MGPLKSRGFIPEYDFVNYSERFRKLFRLVLPYQADFSYFLDQSAFKSFLELPDLALFQFGKDFMRLLKFSEQDGLRVNTVPVKYSGLTEDANSVEWPWEMISADAVLLRRAQTQAAHRD